jgi:hypothetical protein
MPDSMKGSDILIQPGQDPSDNGKKPIEKERIEKFFLIRSFFINLVYIFAYPSMKVQAHRGIVPNLPFCYELYLNKPPA